MKKLFQKLKKRYELYVAVQKQRDNIRLVVGSGTGSRPADILKNGWIFTDIYALNIIKEADCKKTFQPNSIRAILAEHVWEHLTPEDGVLAIRNCFKYLKNGGYLRIAVPDGFHPDPNYINYVKVGGTGAGAIRHKVLFTHQSLGASLTQSGFTIDLLEYFDENGIFHAQDWNPDDGKIIRSIRFDKRNEDGLTNFTSLIVDAIKK